MTKPPASQKEEAGVLIVPVIALAAVGAPVPAVPAPVLQPQQHLLLLLILTLLLHFPGPARKATVLNIKAFGAKIRILQLIALVLV